MKKLILLICLLSGMSAILMAQYKKNKDVYDYRAYTYQPGDPYKPSTMTVASAFVPGVGEIFMGELKRGLFFLIPSFSISLLNLFFDGGLLSSDPYDPLSITTYVLKIGLRVFSSIDASHVAKVNNMSLRDRNKINSKLTFTPILGKMENSNKGNTTIVGFSFTGRF